MSFASSNNLYGFPQPLSRAFPAPILAQRAPTNSDISYPIGQLWVDQSGDDYYGLVDVTAGVATWVVLASQPGNIDTLTGDSGGAISPSAGNIDLLGTANQIVSTGSGHQIEWSLSSTMVAPGTVEVTGLLTTDAGITASGGALTLNSGTNAINVSNDASATTINLGTGAAAKAVTIGSSNTTSATTIACGTGGVAVGTSANAHTSTFGSTNSTSATTIQSGSGGITLTGAVTASSNVTLNGAATKLSVHGGAVTDFIGTATLNNGTVTVANTNIAATDRILVSRSAVNASSALGVFTYSISAATSFTITALKPADATTETGDASTVSYFIVRQI